MALIPVPSERQKAKAGPDEPRPEILEVHDKIVDDLKQVDGLVK